MLKHFFPVYVRGPLIFAIVFIGLEYFVDSGDRPAFMKYPMLSVLLLLIIFVLVAIEIVLYAVKKVSNDVLSSQSKEKDQEEEVISLSDTLIQSLTGSKSVEEEGTVMMDHDYDGIKELDNVLPPWWVGLFYITVIVGVVYMFYYHLGPGLSQVEEFQAEMKRENAKVAEYLKTRPDTINLDNVVLLTEKDQIEHGRSVYIKYNCMSCHGAELQGNIGPNLTDDYWINGGGIKNIFEVISEGSKTNPVMTAWKNNIKPTDIQYLSSYIISTRGSNPDNAIKPQGDIWKAPERQVENEKVKDSLPQSVEKQVEEKILEQEQPVK